MGNLLHGVGGRAAWGVSRQHLTRPSLTRPSLARSSLTRLAVVVVAALLAGCQAPSVWETNLEHGPEGSGPASMMKAAAPEQVASVKVRRAPWERVQSALVEIERSAAASDVPMEEWTPDKLAESEARLLKGLQVTAPASRVQVLARSTFHTTEQLPKEDTLQALGARLGATHVVWSSQVVGQVNKVVSTPVTSSTFGTRYRRDRDGNREPDSYHENTTTYVPVSVTADEVGAIAYFLRIEE